MANITRISPAEALRLMGDGYVYLDVRTEHEYAAGHPKGAHNVPLLHAGVDGMEPNEDFLTSVEALYPKDAKLVIGCRLGHQSLHAAGVLLDAGYEHVVDQRAGYDGVRDAFGQLTEPGWAPLGLPSEGGSYAERKKLASTR